jgi:adenosylcobinamide kinase/adenosylcobinamide-phosphate guanylyltransferase
MTCELILGGARSGKSREAERRAVETGLAVTVIATAEALDEEMAARIRRHQADRPAGWRTVEAPLALADTLRREAAAERCLIVDCLTLWLSNLLADAHILPAGATAENLPRFRHERDALLAVLPTLPGRIVLVANEVGARPGAGDAARTAVPRRGRTAQPDGGERMPPGCLRRRRPAAGAEGRLNFGAKHTFRERAVGPPAQKHKMTLEDFLAWEAEQPERWEFFNGEAFMMAGGVGRA